VGEVGKSFFKVEVGKVRGGSTEDEEHLLHPKRGLIRRGRGRGRKTATLK